MQRIEVKPAAELAGVVDRIWYLEDAQQAYGYSSIFPDPYRELIIHWGAPITLQIGTGRPTVLPAVYVSNLQKGPHRLWATGSSHVLAVRIYPWTIVGICASEGAQTRGDFFLPDRKWQAFAKEIPRVVTRRGFAEAAAQLEQFIRDRCRLAPASLSAIDGAGLAIYASHGDLAMSAVAAQNGLSESHFERLFRLAAGVAPKTYARLVRFEAFCNALIAGPEQTLVDLALESGYSDQAHLNHDFKALTGLTPGELATRAREYLKR